MKSAGLTTELHSSTTKHTLHCEPSRIKSIKPPLNWRRKVLVNFFLLHYFRTLNRGHRTFTCHDLWQSNSLVKVTPITDPLYLVRLTWRNPFGSEQPPMTTHLNQKENGKSMKDGPFARKHTQALLTLNKWYVASLDTSSFWAMCKNVSRSPSPLCADLKKKKKLFGRMFFFLLVMFSLRDKFLTFTWHKI